MPAPLIALWLILAGAGTSLLGPPAVWKGKDPMSKGSHRRKPKLEYFTWLSSPEHVKGVCHFTVFAMVSQSAVHRLRINGVEQEIDWSWKWTAEIPEGKKADGLIVEFIDPVTGAVVATHDVGGECWPMQIEATW